MSKNGKKNRRVTLGQIVATRGIIESLFPADVTRGLERHARGDWGDVCDEDWQANDNALAHGGRLLSVYRSAQGVKFWIITEADRSVTTVLLPEEY